MKDGDRYPVELRLEGEESDPEALDLYDLCGSLRALTSVILKHGDISPEAGRPPVVSLTGVTGGQSTLLELSMTDAGRAAVSDLTGNLVREDNGFKPEVLIGLRQLHDRLARRGLALSFRDNFELGIHAVELDAPYDPQILTETTTIYGKCMRVGGQRPPTAEIRTEESGVVIARLSSTKLASSLASRLYDRVALEGKARWVLPEFQMSEFEATDLLPYVDRGLEHAFAQLRDLVGDAWDEMDAADYVADLRGYSSGES